MYGNFFICIIVVNIIVFLYFYIIFINNGTYYVISNYSINSSENIQEISTETVIKLLTSDELPYCSDIPRNLSGNVIVITSPIPSERELEKKFSWLRPGGHNVPSCKQNQTVAIVVPFRNRLNQLLIFLNHMHPFLKKQEANYTIFIIEQNDTLPFNRGQLMNVGYMEALKIANFSCFIFHDVDLLPEDDRILYRCSDVPVLMSSAIDKFNYNIPYKDYTGGVVSMNRKLFKKINGFPNRYKTLEKEKEHFLTDGLSNLKYNVKEIINNLLYTKVLVDLK